MFMVFTFIFLLFFCSFLPLLRFRFFRTRRVCSRSFHPAVNPAAAAAADGTGPTIVIFSLEASLLLGVGVRVYLSFFS